jgi:ribonuclease-3
LADSRQIRGDVKAGPLDEIEAAVGHRFADRGLLEQALIHSSAREEFGMRDNQVLEFLGDSVLGLAISDLAAAADPTRDEGDLTRLRASLVNATSLAEIARGLELGAWVKLGKGEERSGGREKERILSACYEAIIGAVFRDSGYPTVCALVESHFGTAIVTGTAPWDFKTALQEHTQQRGQGTPSYRLLRQTGPAHERRFEVEVVLGGESLGTGDGASLKEAEQIAARNALTDLEQKPSPKPERRR